VESPGTSAIYRLVVDGDSASASDGEQTTSDGEPTTSGGEPTTSGGEPTTSGGEPTTSDGEPTTSGGDGLASATANRRARRRTGERDRPGKQSLTGSLGNPRQ